MRLSFPRPHLSMIPSAAEASEYLLQHGQTKKERLVIRHCRVSLVGIGKIMTNLGAGGGRLGDQILYLRVVHGLGGTAFMTALHRRLLVGGQCIPRFHRLRSLRLLQTVLM